MRNWVRSSILAVAALAGMPLCAAGELEAAIAACRAETDEADRLACYDREADYVSQKHAAQRRAEEKRSPAASTPPASASTEPGIVTSETTTTTADEKFGYRGGPLARAEAEEKEKEREHQGPEQVFAKVTALSTRAQGQIVVTLDNGQVWLQKKRDPNVTLKVGDEVKIERGVLKSYLMSRSTSKRTTRVTRVR